MDATKVTGDVIDGLKGHPYALAFVVMNFLFIAASTYTLWSIAQAGERRDVIMAQMAKDCIVEKK
jgi:hypothetical protein